MKLNLFSTFLKQEQRAMIVFVPWYMLKLMCSKGYRHCKMFEGLTESKIVVLFSSIVSTLINIGVTSLWKYIVWQVFEFDEILRCVLYCDFDLKINLFCI